MQKIKYILFSLIFVISFALTGCSEEKAYDIIISASKVTESQNELQLELEYEIANYSDEDYYFTFVFPSYIQDALITKVGIGELSANNRISGVEVIAVSKDSDEMTEETIDALLSGELPFVKQVLIGKAISLD